jgi:hypothetical protein
MTASKKPTSKDTRRPIPPDASPRRASAGGSNGKARAGKAQTSPERILNRAAAKSLSTIERRIAPLESHRQKLETLVTAVTLDIQDTIAAHPIHFSNGNHFSVTFAYQEASSELLEALIVAGKHTGEFPGIPLDTTMRSIYKFIFTKTGGGTKLSEQKLRKAVKGELDKLLS